MLVYPQKKKPSRSKECLGDGTDKMKDNKRIMKSYSQEAGGEVWKLWWGNFVNLEDKAWS